MSLFASLSVYAGILLLLAVAGLASIDSKAPPVRTLALSRIATVTMAVIAIAVLLISLTTASAGAVAPGNVAMLSLRLDLLGTSMLAMIAFIGVIVTDFGCRYLEGEPRHASFLGSLCLTIASACMFVTAGNLVLFWLAFVATSLSLHRLLLFFPARPLARLAARKKFLIARAADLSLLAAFSLLARDFGTLDIGTIGSMASETHRVSPLAAGLLVVAATLKSAQFPLHGWITEVMETPTPVSALLHAGIVNAGGFLVLRFADVLLAAPAALHALAFVGLVTALFASAVMPAQSNIKEFLAWSTISQMGFMLLQCGLGLFPLAWLHILAHSFYKAHAFLSAGSVVTLARDEWLPDLRGDPGLSQLLVNMAVAVMLYLAAGWSLGLLPDEHISAQVLGATAVLGLTSFLVQANQQRHLRVSPYQTIAIAALTGVSYFALQALAFHAMQATLPLKPSPDALDYALLGLALIAFATLMIAQHLLPRWYATAIGKSLRVHLANGLYLNLLLNRLLGALRRVTV